MGKYCGKWVLPKQRGRREGHRHSSSDPPPNSLAPHQAIIGGHSPFVRIAVRRGLPRGQMKVRQKEAVLDAAVAEQELPGTQRELELPGLATNSTFMVQVRAVSEYDDCGAWSPETRFLTLNDLRSVCASASGESDRPK